MPTWLLMSTLLLAGCGFTESPPRCVMGQEHTLGKANGLAFDDLALTALGKHTYAFWSDAAGLHGAVLSAQGTLVQAPKRLADACPGGIAAVAHGASIALACLRPFRGAAVVVADETDDGVPDTRSGHAALLMLSATLGVESSRVLGEAGRVSRGIDVGGNQNALAVVWHDGALDASRIWLWRGGDEAESLLLSSPLSVPTDPSLTWLDGRLWLMWSEAARRAKHDKRSPALPRDEEQRLVLSRGEGAPTVVTTVTHEDPTPRLRAHAGALYLAFRDKRDRGRKPGLYVARISERGALIGEMARLSRADAKAGPAIVPCFDGLLAVAPRTFGGGKFVGVNWVDKSLTRSSQERQYYEDSRQFARAAGTCLTDHALLLIGEQGNSERPDVFLRTVGFRCQ